MFWWDLRADTWSILCSSSHWWYDLRAVATTIAAWNSEWSRTESHNTICRKCRTCDRCNCTDSCIGYLVVSYGLLKGKGWAWTITVVLSIVSVVIRIISVIPTSMFNASFPSDMNALVSRIIAHIVGLAINGVILYYLYRPNVKAYFGKSRTSTTIQM